MQKIDDRMRESSIIAEFEVAHRGLIFWNGKDLYEAMLHMEYLESEELGGAGTPASKGHEEMLQARMTAYLEGKVGEKRAFCYWFRVFWTRIILNAYAEPLTEHGFLPIDGGKESDALLEALAMVPYSQEIGEGYSFDIEQVRYRAVAAFGWNAADDNERSQIIIRGLAPWTAWEWGLTFAKYREYLTGMDEGITRKLMLDFCTGKYGEIGVAHYLRFFETLRFLDEHQVRLAQHDFCVAEESCTAELIEIMAELPFNLEVPRDGGTVRVFRYEDVVCGAWARRNLGERK